jgi:hypothetical protein
MAAKDLLWRAVSHGNHGKAHGITRNEKQKLFAVAATTAAPWRSVYSVFSEATAPAHPAATPAFRLRHDRGGLPQVSAAQAVEIDRFTRNRGTREHDPPIPTAARTADGLRMPRIRALSFRRCGDSRWSLTLEVRRGAVGRQWKAVRMAVYGSLLHRRC